MSAVVAVASGYPECQCRAYGCVLNESVPHGRHGDGGEDSRRLEVSLQDRVVLVRAAGYSALDGSAEGVAAARHLLETVLRRPVLVRSLRASAGRALLPAS